MNTREIATVIWLAVLVGFTLSRRDSRSALAVFVACAATSRLVIPVAAMTAYVAGLIYASARIGIWDPSLTSAVVAWFIGTGLGLFAKGVFVFTGRGSFRRLLFASVGLTVYVEGFVNLYVLPVALELALLPVLAFVAMLSAVAAREDKYTPAKRLADRLLATIGCGLFVYVIVRLATGWTEFERSHGLQQVALPVVLTLATLPFVALLGLWSNYDTAFSRIRWATKDHGRRWRARIMLVAGLHVRARDVGAFNGPWCHDLVAASSVADARCVLRRFRSDPIVARSTG